MHLEAHKSTYNAQTSYQAPNAPEWFPPLLLSVSSVKDKSLDVHTAQDVLKIIRRLEVDDYLIHVSRFYEEGIRRFGDEWHYADILTTLAAATKFAKPKRYLEVGVRRGRSLAIVAALQRDCEIYGFDLWMDNYAGMPNPGPDFVKKEIAKLGHRGKFELISGDSHETLPRFFQENPDLCFDLVTVDGDHSEQGAEQDILDVLPALSIGGMLVFDDICHPSHPELKRLWTKLFVDNTKFATYLYDELGFGVALAIRKSF